MAFENGHTHSAKPRKRRTLSEAMLSDALRVHGEKTLEIITAEYKNDDPEIRLKAAVAFSKLIFIQSKEEDDNTGNQLNIFALKRVEELEAKLLALENSKSHD